MASLRTERFPLSNEVRMSARIMSLAVGALAALAACNSEISPPTASNTGASNPTSFAKGGKHVKVVTESDVSRQPEDSPPLKSWVVYIYPGGGTGTFRVGPGNPPQGDGSFEFVTATPTEHSTLFNFDYHETPVADFTELGYQTYQSSAAVPVQLPSINLTVDLTGGTFVSGDFATLVFEPVYNVAQGPIVPGTWQDWDAIFGGQAIWWLTRNSPLGNRGVTFTWNAFKAVFPDATILGGIGPNQGSGGAALTASVDEFIVGVSGKHATIYDFEACDDRGHGNDKCKAKGNRGGND
jgi:hypothetical protein